MVKRHSVMEIPPTVSPEAGETDRKPTRARASGLPLRAAVWGASGATGAEVLRQCLADGRIGEIVVFTRRRLQLDERQRARVTEVHVEDFLDVQKHLDDMRNIDVAYWCLGVSQLHEPKKAGYRRVTRDFTVASATVLKQAS
jgi:putative NADH-flavin reductase